MIIREFVPNDLKRVCEIEKMSFDESYELNMFKQLYDIGAGFLVAEDDGYVVGYVLFWINMKMKATSYLWLLIKIIKENKQEQNCC